MADPAAEERRRAWLSSSDPVVRDRNYARVLRRQFGADGYPRRRDDPPPDDGPIGTVDTAPL